MNKYQFKTRMAKVALTTFAITLASTLTMSAQGLRETVGRHFLIGTAMTPQQVTSNDAKLNGIIDKHFNAVVAENCMKPEVVQPEEGKFDFTQGDQLADYAAKHNMKLTGHVLVWHSQTPMWFFRDSEGKPCSREVLIERMKTHITTVMKHFKGKVIGWDVVNEAIEDDGSYRQSEYFKIIGPEFIEIALRAAMEADPDAELYLNDYSMSKPGKRNKYCEIIRDLKAKGVRIDAIGMQSHNGMDYPDPTEYEKSMDAFANEGVKLMMTELDLNVLPNPQDFGGAEVSQNFKYEEKLNPYRKGLTAKAEKNINKRWMELWNIYYRHRADIKRITLWGVDDQQSWLNDFPVPGRTNYALFFDRNRNEKKIVKEVSRLFK